MLKSLATKLMGFYLYPLRRSERLYYFVKGVFFSNAAEHLYWATRYIRKNATISRDEIVIDVGGWNGGTSVYFADRFPGHKVYCVEPNPRMAGSLRTVESPTIIVMPVALGRASGEALLHVTANDVSSSLNDLRPDELRNTPSDFQAMLAEQAQVRVHVSTLDEEFRDSPGVLLIKLDTQGTELDVVKGGEQVLKKTRFILTEMNNHQYYGNTCQYYEMDGFLRSRSFALADVVVTYRGDDGVTEFDALYRNTDL